MRSISVRADVEKNRLYLTLAGEPTLDKVKVVKRVIESELLKLQPGFAILNDSRDLKLNSARSFELIQDVMEMIAKAKPGKIARLASPVSRMMLSRASAIVGFNVKEFSDLKKAEEYLNYSF